MCADSVAMLKKTAAGRELELLSRVGGIPSELLDGRHHPCPQCGGTDRFRLIDPARGAVICNQCFRQRNGDFIAAIQWALRTDFGDAVRQIARYLGIPTSGRPAVHSLVEPIERDECLIRQWLETPRGRAINISGLKSCHAFLAHHQGHKVISLPIFGQDGQRIGHSIMDAYGKLLPANGGSPVKNKTIKPKGIKGWMGQVDRIDAAEIVWKVEGMTDLLALASLGLPIGHAAISNANGSEENAAPWIARRLASKRVFVVHDADIPGERGAQKWAAALQAAGSAVKTVRLPYPIEPTHGKDLRDFLVEGGDVYALAETATGDLVDAGPKIDPSMQAGIGSGDLSILSPSGRTDIANSLRFAERFDQELLYVPEWNRWLAWDGTRWQHDCQVRVFQCAKNYAESLWDELRANLANIDREKIAAVQSFVRSTSQRRKIGDFIRLAESDSRLVCPVERLNSNPLALNCPNGTVDLASGQLRPHLQSDWITQVTRAEFHPEAKCPLWHDTLNLIFDGDASLIRYVQQLLGYSISGDPSEAILPIAYGRGCNGKSTIWNPIVELLGDYATMASESLLLGNTDNHPTEKAQLYQRRFVAVSEPDRGMSMKESRVKELTGDMFVTARRMHENFWTFRRTHVFWLSTNHLPLIKGVDEGIWRRIKLIPFTVDLRRKVEPIRGISDLLVSKESSGILAWLVRGFLDWKQNGFVEPVQVAEATKQYRAESDTLAEFLANYCEVADHAECPASTLFEAYQLQYQGPLSKTAFGLAMSERFAKQKPKSGTNRDKVVYKGVQLRRGRA